MRPVWWHDMNRYKRIKEPGLVTGVRNICRYMQIGPQTFYRLHTKHGLPAMHLPDGRWCTSRTLIDDWVLARCKAQRLATASPV